MAGSANAVQTVKLAWVPSPDSNVSGYNVYFGSASAQYTNHIFVSGASTTNTTINNLLDGVTYYFAATATGTAADESTFSNEVNYQSAPVVTPPVTPAISWNAPAAISFGTALSTAQLNASANVPGSFTYTPSLNSVLAAGNGQTLSAVFTPADTTTYTTVTTTVLLNVSKAALTVTANPVSRIYGAANPALTASYSGFVNGDTAASLATPVSLATTATTTSPIGSYPITASGATSPNYAITFVNGSLNVSSAVLTITADAKTKTYGSANPTFTATYSGFINGDTASSLTSPVTLTTTATAGSPVGSYTITASGATSPNYTINFVNGSLNVTSAALTIAAESKSKAFGAANPALTATYSGFVNGDSSSSLTTPVTLATTATTTSPIGSYPITASGATSPNYAITFVNGSLNVSSAVLTITADAKTKTYGSANPTLTVSYAGFLNGDTAASLTTPVSLTTTATAGSPVGSYTITASGATSPNYTINFVNGSLNVTPAALTIAADAKSKTYGAANPALTATYAGFVNGDSSSSLTSPVTLAATATAASHVGTYPITATAAASPNYTIAYVNNNMSVTPAALTITANNQSKVAGTANPALTASYAGFVNGETAATLTIPVSLATTATTSSPSGSYPINASGAQDSDYAISFVNGTMTVTPAAAPSLVSMAVSTSTGSINIGQTAQFTAIGSYSDGSVSNLTAAATWISSATAVASVSGTGLATGLTAGGASISAAMSGISGSAALTVKANAAGGTVTLASTIPMTMPTIGLASPYSTTISASGLAGVVSKVTVTLNNVTHSWPHDINVMLVGPSGQKALLMRHAGGGYSVANIAITIDDDAKNKMPNSAGLKTGSYKPTNYGTVYNFASPAPAAPYSCLLSGFNGSNPNGVWTLYVLDDSSGDAGSIQGWSLNLTTTTIGTLDIPQPGQEPDVQADTLSVKPDITTPPAVWIETMGFNTNGQASLVLSGRPDTNYTVQSTTDFVQWTEVQSGVSPVGQFTVEDPQSGSNARKFYRVVLP